MAPLVQFGQSPPTTAIIPPAICGCRRDVSIWMGWFGISTLTGGRSASLDCWNPAQATRSHPGVETMNLWLPLRDVDAPLRVSGRLLVEILKKMFSSPAPKGQS